MTNRIESIVELDQAIDSLERVVSQMNHMGCTYTMMNRIQAQLRGLVALRVDILQADLLDEEI